VVRERNGPESREHAAALASLARNLLLQQQYLEAESMLRDCLVIREQKEADSWTTYHTKSLLGGAVLGKKQYADAEPLLLQGYEGMKARQESMPEAKLRLSEAAARLVELYDGWGKPDQAALWREQQKADAARKTLGLNERMLSGTATVANNRITAIHGGGIMLPDRPGD
jgi:hypothetical protein